MNKKDFLEQSQQFLKAKGIKDCTIGIVLGTGLDGLSNEIVIERDVPYEEIPHFPKSTMPYHKARLLYGSLNGQKVMVFEGRFHAYEGLNFFEITYSIRLMHAMGVKTVIISNAAGALNLEYHKGEVMLITDHINLQGGSPLAEKRSEALGERFVDMSAPYSPILNEQVREIASKKKLTLHQGVYVAVIGPQLETKAEYRFLKIIGADAVGMSTVPEVIVANQLKMDCIAFSALTDVCDPDNLSPIDIEDIMASAKKAEQTLMVLVKELISTL